MVNDYTQTPQSWKSRHWVHLHWTWQLKFHSHASLLSEIFLIGKLGGKNTYALLLNNFPIYHIYWTSSTLQFSVTSVVLCHYHVELWSMTDCWRDVKQHRREHKKAFDTRRVYATVYPHCVIFNFLAVFKTSMHLFIPSLFALFLRKTIWVCLN